ncbi:MAG: hypothetical protein AUG89_11855 [Acidobacteria bacterium 13_1_20CM_4_56_7]|nr:MAG: hypothetical protein AUG89_11855 [Acidobacteria bacterium 13_1_20CM_4_56_7]
MSNLKFETADCAWDFNYKITKSLNYPIYFTSLCGVCLRHRRQNFFISSLSGFVLRFLVVE